DPGEVPAGDLPLDVERRVALRDVRDAGLDGDGGRAGGVEAQGDAAGPGAVAGDRVVEAQVEVDRVVVAPAAEVAAADPAGDLPVADEVGVRPVHRGGAAVQFEQQMRVGAAGEGEAADAGASRGGQLGGGAGVVRDGVVAGHGVFRVVAEADGRAAGVVAHVPGVREDRQVSGGGAAGAGEMSEAEARDVAVPV